MRAFLSTTLQFLYFQSLLSSALHTRLPQYGIWNRLPTEAVNSASVEQFKIELDKVIDTLI